MKTETELKDCPFCGSNAVLHESSKGFRVVCQNTHRPPCDIGNTHGDWTRDAAIEMWNRRPIDYQPGIMSTPLPAPQPGGGGEARCSTCGGLRDENGGCSNSFHIPRPAPIALPVRRGETFHGVTGIPHCGIVDKDGDIIGRSNGTTTEHAIARANAIVAALNSPRSETEGHHTDPNEWDGYKDAAAALAHEQEARE